MHYLTKIKGKFDNLSSEALASLPDGNYTITKRTKKRSIEQNSSYWLLRVQPITNWLKEQGNQVSEDDVHYWLKVKFLGYKFIDINHKQVKVLKSTKDLSTLDFAAFMNEIAIYFSEKGLYLKDPNQQEFLGEQNERN
jgi:hypothetical protein